LRRLPLVERRERLHSLLPKDQRFPIQFSEHWDGSARQATMYSPN
jgi:hypothetical protein